MAPISSSARHGGEEFAAVVGKQRIDFGELGRHLFCSFSSGPTIASSGENNSMEAGKTRYGNPWKTLAAREENRRAVDGARAVGSRRQREGGSESSKSH